MTGSMTAGLGTTSNKDDIKELAEETGALRNIEDKREGREKELEAEEP